MKKSSYIIKFSVPTEGDTIKVARTEAFSYSHAEKIVKSENGKSIQIISLTLV